MRISVLSRQDVNNRLLLKLLIRILHLLILVSLISLLQRLSNFYSVRIGLLKLRLLANEIILLTSGVNIWTSLQWEIRYEIQIWLRNWILILTLIRCKILRRLLSLVLLTPRDQTIEVIQISRRNTVTSLSNALLSLRNFSRRLILILYLSFVWILNFRSSLLLILNLGPLLGHF